MSRECNLDIRFTILETERELAEQLADLLKEQFSIDRIGTSENGYSIEAWNCEHYYLSEVMPLITRIVAAVFPDRRILSSGSGEYSVVDDIYGYGAEYDPKNKEVSCGRHHRWEGNREEEAEHYGCGVGLTEEEFEYLIPYTEKPGYSQLHDRLNVIKSNPAMHVKSSRWAIRYYENIPYGVKNIRSNEFSNRSDLKSITIPDSVTSIGDWAFMGCKNLTDIIIPSSVTSIGESAFSYCENLTSITIPDGVTSIGEEAFYGCTSLTSVTIPDGVTSIGGGAFQGCTSLTSVTFPETASIGYLAFADTPFEKALYDDPANWEDGILYMGNVLIKADESLSGEYAIKAGIKGIAGGAFDGCENLISVTIPDSVLWIGDDAFIGCKNLISVTIPDSVTSIGESAFYGCTSLTTITIPDSVTSIGYAAFIGCKNLTTITIPDSVTSIGDRAFDGCRSLMSVTIPSSVTSIGYAAFSDCTSLTNITIPESVTSIGEFAFNGCKNLTDITIPYSVTSIGSRAFQGCESMPSIIIPYSVTTFGDDVFDGCDKLTIHATAGSYAERYAREDSIPFMAV